MGAQHLHFCDSLSHCFKLFAFPLLGVLGILRDGWMDGMEIWFGFCLGLGKHRGNPFFGRRGHSEGAMKNRHSLFIYSFLLRFLSLTSLHPAFL